MGSLGAPLLILASDHSAGHLWLEVRAGDQSCALLLVVLCQHVPFVGELCAAFAREGKAAAGTPHREGESAANSYTRACQPVPVGTFVMQEGVVFAESPVCVHVPGVCLISVCILQQKGYVCV